jgi:hypothetical protein
VQGRVLNTADQKPISNVNVFLSNATIGDKTAMDGSFKLTNVSPGKYDLVVSIVGFKTYSTSLTVDSKDIKLPDILISPKINEIHEVTIVSLSDSKRALYYSWFLPAFLGTSSLAKNCTIENPEIIDYTYDKETDQLNASTSDFLVIKNNALGYTVKYLLSDFLITRPTFFSHKISYHGFVLFEEMKGTHAEERQWKRARAAVYENSMMHFLRSLLNGGPEREGFTVQLVSKYKNPDRPADSIINARIRYFSNINPKNKKTRDSLSYWNKKSKLDTTITTLQDFNLDSREYAYHTDQPGLYSIGCNFDQLLVNFT